MNSVFLVGKLGLKKEARELNTKAAFFSCDLICKTAKGELVTIPVFAKDQWADFLHGYYLDGRFVSITGQITRFNGCLQIEALYLDSAPYEEGV